MTSETSKTLSFYPLPCGFHFLFVYCVCVSIAKYMQSKVCHFHSPQAHGSVEVPVVDRWPLPPTVHSRAFHRPR